MPREIPEEKKNQVAELLMQGRKIDAIKLYRELTGQGLKESKDEVEEFEASLRSRFPDKFVSSPKGKGCLGVLILLCLFAGALVLLFIKGS